MGASKKQRGTTEVANRTVVTRRITRSMTKPANPSMAKPITPSMPVTRVNSKEKKSYTSLTLLKRHQKEHRPEFKCDNCEKLFVSSRNLEKHKKNIKCKKASKRGNKDVFILFSTNFEFEREFHDPYFAVASDIPRIITAPRFKLELADFNGRYQHQELIDLTEMEDSEDLMPAETKVDMRLHMRNLIVAERVLDNDESEAGPLERPNASSRDVEILNWSQNINANEPPNQSAERLAELYPVKPDIDTYDDDDCVIIDPQSPVLTNAPPTIEDPEDVPTFMSDAIHQRAVSHPEELMFVWSNSLEDDLLMAASVNRAHCLLCIRDFYMIHLTENQTKLLMDSHNVTFMTVDLKGEIIPWTVLSFDRKYCPLDLCNRTFGASLAREELVTEFAASRGMTIRNLAKFDTPGLLSSVFYRPEKDVVDLC